MNDRDVEDSYFGEDSECYGTDMDYWRWCEHLSIVEASMLAVGLNPSQYEPTDATKLHEGHFHRIGTSNHVKNYLHSIRFIPVFRATSYAALKGELPCDFAHHARTIPTQTFGDRDFDGPPEEGEERIDYDCLIRSDAPVSSNFDIPNYENLSHFYFIKEPDWCRSTIEVTAFKNWMQKRGRKPAFFFPDTGSDTEAFRDPTHEHFSAELDIAVSTWLALLPRRAFPRGVKATIEEWIDKNPDAWRSDEPMSAAAQERIATLVNWNKSGGAPKAGS